MVSKRLLDIFVSSACLVIFSPLFILIPLLILLEDGWPVFFNQERAGKDGRPFMVYKFRTMRNLESDYISDADRITKVGRFLRSTGFDELPQFINILKGEMSVVGPRPTLPYQIENYNDEQRKRLSVKPGVTGWTAVNGGHFVSWAERIQMDLWYIDNFSLWLDLRIILFTPFVMLRGRPAYFDNSKDKMLESSPEQLDYVITESAIAASLDQYEDLSNVSNDNKP